MDMIIVALDMVNKNLIILNMVIKIAYLMKPFTEF